MVTSLNYNHVNILNSKSHLVMKKYMAKSKMNKQTENWKMLKKAKKILSDSYYYEIMLMHK